MQLEGIENAISELKKKRASEDERGSKTTTIFDSSCLNISNVFFIILFTSTKISLECPHESTLFSSLSIHFFLFTFFPCHSNFYLPLLYLLPFPFFCSFSHLPQPTSASHPPGLTHHLCIVIWPHPSRGWLGPNGSDSDAGKLCDVGGGEEGGVEDEDLSSREARGNELSEWKEVCMWTGLRRRARKKEQCKET